MDSKLPWDGKRTLAITEKIGQWIVLNDQTLSEVSRVAFKCLIEHLKPHYIIPSCHYIVDKIIPKMHDAGARTIVPRLYESDCALETDFKLQRAVLHECGRFQNTVDAIMSTVKEMLHDRKVDKKTALGRQETVCHYNHPPKVSSKLEAL